MVTGEDSNAPGARGDRSVDNAVTSADGQVARRRATPRASDEIRRLLLDAARARFSESGYSGATTRRIAAEAGVNEALLFRHFGSKQALFRQSVVEPLQEAFVALVERWKSVAYGATPHDPMATMMPYVKSLSEFVDTYRPMLMATLTAAEYETDTDTDADAMFGPMFEWLEEGTRAEAEAHGWSDFDPFLAPRIVFALVTAMRLFDPWLLPAGSRRPSRRRVNREVSEFLIHGLAHRSAETGPGAIPE